VNKKTERKQIIKLNLKKGIKNGIRYKPTPMCISVYQTEKKIKSHGISILGKRRYDRKQSGYGGQTKVIFRKKVLDSIIHDKLSIRVGLLRYLVLDCIAFRAYQFGLFLNVLKPCIV